jgi:hypothetical protein
LLARNIIAGFIIIFFFSVIMRLSQNRLLLLVLLSSHVSIRTAVPIQLDNAEGKINQSINQSWIQG